MCLSTVYRYSDGQKEEVMQDVVFIEAKDEGFLLIGLMGEEKFVQGTIKSVDFTDGQLLLDDRA